MMTNLDALYRAVDELDPEELDQLNTYIQQRRRLTWWIVPPENLQKLEQLMRPVQEDAQTMSDAEINAAIDEALDEVRRERHQGRS